MNRRDQLRRLYGFDFPDDLFRFWEFVNRLQPLDPLHALFDPLEIILVGPFEVLSGRFDGRSPRLSPLLHWRYYLDPPEFFTVLAGDVDRLHWGYYLDDPADGRGCVASYYADDAFELSADGDDLFQAVRLELEAQHHDCEEYLGEDRRPRRRLRGAAGAARRAAEGGACERHRRPAGTGRRLLREVPFGGRPQRRRDRVHAGGHGRRRASGDLPAAVAAGQETAFAAPERGRSGRPWSRKAAGAARRLPRGGPEARQGAVADARRAARRNTPIELLDAAYAALGREALRQVLRTHRAHRDLPSVDIFVAEGEMGNGEA